MIANFTQYTELYQFHYCEECFTSNPNTYMTKVLCYCVPNMRNTFYYSVECERFVHKNVTHFKSNIEIIMYSNQIFTYFHVSLNDTIAQSSIVYFESVKLETVLAAAMEIKQISK